MNAVVQVILLILQEKNAKKNGQVEIINGTSSRILFIFLAHRLYEIR